VATGPSNFSFQWWYWLGWVWYSTGGAVFMVAPNFGIKVHFTGRQE
jgi:hypothetical protein